MRFERMKCGACGKGTMRVYAARSNDGRDAFAGIELRCSKACGTRTRFVIAASIMQDNHANPESPGSHCVGWGKD